MDDCKTSDSSLTREQIDYLRLALVHGVGPRTMLSLVEYFGSASEALAASECQLKSVERVGPKLSQAIRESKSTRLVDRVVDHCQRNQVRILFPTDEDFPEL